MLYFLASTVTLAASSWGVYGPSNSAHCVPFSTSITCAHALSPCTPPPAGSTPMMYFFPVTGGRKYNMRPVFLLVIILRRLLQLDVQLLAIEHAIARSEEAGLGVLGVLLWKTIAELAPHLAAEGDLPGIELVLRHQLEFLVGEVEDLDIALVTLLPPPRQEVLHVAGFGRALPLFIKCSASAAGGGFQKDLTVGGTAARNAARVSATSCGQRATSEQSKFWMVSPRPAQRSAALSTRYSLSSLGKIIWRTLAREVFSALRRHGSGRFSRKRCTMRKISSADCWSCATCTLSVPGCSMVERKNRAAT